MNVATLASPPVSDLEAFRARGLAWLESVAPAFGRDARAGLDVEDDLALGRRYQAAKFAAGFAGINWPTEWGGQGLGHLDIGGYHLVLDEHATLLGDWRR